MSSTLVLSKIMIFTISWQNIDRFLKLLFNEKSSLFSSLASLLIVLCQEMKVVSCLGINLFLFDWWTEVFSWINSFCINWIIYLSIFLIATFFYFINLLFDLIMMVFAITLISWIFRWLKLWFLRENILRMYLCSN